MPEKTAFLAYNITRRSKVLAGHLHAKIITAKVSPVPVVRLFNYPLLIFLTFLDLIAKKFDAVFVQLPPIHAAIPAYLYGKIFRKQIIFDTHSGIFFTHKWYQKIYLNLYSLMLKHIGLNIVHNEDLLTQALLKDTNTIVLEDKIPFPASPFKPGMPAAITVICGYGKDEPVQEIIEAARSLPGLQFNLTGNSKKLAKQSLPSNLRLTGYLSDTDYLQLLKDSSLIMVLTNRLHTVLCGAFEAVSLTKPLIISDTPTLRKYFYKGVVHTENNAQSIIQAIKNARQNLARLYAEIVELRDEKIKSWQKQFEPVENILKI
jgi:glycosyltransferase involved in cell wall biosynthesis